MGRLFAYSKTSAVVALENFTTEALALAIAADPLPLIRALQRSKVLGQRVPDPAGLVQVDTQVFMAGRFLDMTLRFLDNDGRPVQVWLEVKVDASESGQQLEAYAKQAAIPDPQHQPRLCVLSKVPLPNAEKCNFGWLPWTTLLTVALETIDLHERWVDLIDFLEEQEVADRSQLPVTDMEAASLAVAHQLHGKVSAILTSVNQAVGEVFPARAARLKWTSNGQLIANISMHFRNNGRMICTYGPLYTGLEVVAGNAHWALGVCPGQIRLQDIDNLAELDLPKNWRRDPNSATPLGKWARATSFGSADDVVSWFRAGLGELAASGVVEALLLRETRVPAPTSATEGEPALSASPRN